MRKKILLIICALLSAGLLGAAAYIFMSSNGEAYDRINLERDLADSYLEFVLSDENQKTQDAELETESETENIEPSSDSEDNTELSTEIQEEETGKMEEESEEKAEAEEPGTDEAEDSSSEDESESDEWGVEYIDAEGVEPETLNFDDLEENVGAMEYSHWSPDYAQGTIDCVFEYPKLGIKRGVYKGAILNDLECWMVVTANDYMELGKTSYAMFGHNSMTYEVSLNALLNARLGQKFTLTSKEGEYEYTVSDIFYMDRDSATRKYARQFEDNPVNKAYILTCGRYEHRYTDMIVEGTLRKFTTAAALRLRNAALAEVDEEETAEAQAVLGNGAGADGRKQVVGSTEIQTKLDVIYQDGKLTVRRVDSNGRNIVGGLLALYLKNKDNDEYTKMFEWEPEIPNQSFTALLAGREYEIVELSSPEGYQDAGEISFKINEMSTGVEVIGRSRWDVMAEWVERNMMFAYGIAAGSILLMVFLIALLIPSKKQRQEKKRKKQEKKTKRKENEENS